MELAVFLLFAFLAVASAIVVVAHRNPVYSVMSLVVTLISMAVLIVLLGAPLIAVLLILVYTGAILVLFLFVLMLLNVGRERIAGRGGGLQRVLAVVGSVFFVGLLALIAWNEPLGRTLAPLTPEAVAIKPLARALFSTWILPFEIVGLLLFAAVVAATMLARKDDGSAGQESP